MREEQGELQTTAPMSLMGNTGNEDIHTVDTENVQDTNPAAIETTTKCDVSGIIDEPKE